MTRLRSLAAMLLVLACAWQEPPPSEWETAVAAAEAAYARGDRAGAQARARAIIAAYERDRAARSSADHVAAGRAYLLVSAGDANAVRSAMSAFNRATQADANNLDAEIRIGQLLLDKYNAPDAKVSFEAVLRRDPGNARALLGLARVAAFTGDAGEQALLEKAIAADPKLAEAHVALARLHLEAEAYDSAQVVARRAIALDSTAQDAWAVAGAIAWLTGDSASYRAAHAAAHRLHPRPAGFFAELAEAAVRHRRYAEGVRIAREALALDSTSVRILGLLGTNELRAGEIAAGRARLERAFALDQFNVWHKNTLDLLDRLEGFTTVERGRFRLVAPPEEAELLATYLLPLLETAYDSLAARYHYRPPTPVRIELYRQHADFSVRTVGLAGLGALGASFGPVLVMDAPSARQRGEFNWGSTAWHELAHTFTLGLSDNRTPRWLSEGISVLEERRARPYWGAGPSVEFFAAYATGALRPVSRLNDGFVRPRSPAEVGLSYYMASLVCGMIEAEFGARALHDMLVAYREGLSTEAVFQRVLRSSPEQLDRRFDAWLRAKFAGPLAAAGAQGGGAFAATMRAASELAARDQRDSARVLLERAQAMFPEYAGEDAPARFLAAFARERGDLREALAQVRRITQRSESAWEANLMEAELLMQLGDSAEAIVPLERLIWISPYDVDVHRRIAELAAQSGNHRLAVQQRRAILALDPPDPLEARYQLARALVDAGDATAARRELLTVLEAAPSFEKAQGLLLQLRGRSP